MANRATSFYDKRANQRQTEATASFVRGEQGGRWGIFINTHELLDIRPTPFEVHLDGVHSRVKVGDAMWLESTTIKNPVTGVEMHPGAVLHPRPQHTTVQRPAATRA